MSPDPDRIDVLRIGPRRRDEIVGLEIDDPDRPVLAAAIVAALLVPRVVHAVGDVRAVGRDLALIAARQRHRLLDAALDRHGPEARRAARRPRRARRGEDDRLAVRRPALHVVAAGMPRQPLRLAAFGRHDVDVDVAGVLAAERDPLAVGREMRIGGLSLKARQAARDAAGALDASRCCWRRRTRSASR